MSVAIGARDVRFELGQLAREALALGEVVANERVAEIADELGSDIGDRGDDAVAAHLERLADEAVRPHEGEERAVARGREFRHLAVAAGVAGGVLDPGEAEVGQFIERRDGEVVAGAAGDVVGKRRRGRNRTHKRAEWVTSSAWVRV